MKVNRFLALFLIVALQACQAAYCFYCGTGRTAPVEVAVGCYCPVVRP